METPRRSESRRISDFLIGGLNVAEDEGLPKGRPTVFAVIDGKGGVDIAIPILTGNVNPQADAYFVSRDAPEVERLAAQHRLILGCQGYYLHPDILSNVLFKGARIADLSTGSGIWLRDLAEASPAAEYHGFDIADSMFPIPNSLPSNVQFLTADVRQPFEQRWLGYFDIVHLRYVQAGMQTGNGAITLKNVITLLRPGGWLQWVECDAPVALCHPVRPAAPKDAWERYASSAQWRPPRLQNLARCTRLPVPDSVSIGMNHGYMNLPTMFADPAIGNLQQVDCDAFVVDRPDDEEATRSSQVNVVINAGRSVLKGQQARGEMQSSVDFDEWEKLALEDVERGGHWIVRVGVFIGRRNS